MKKLYGSLTNRLEENCYFNNTENNIKVGTLATIYNYSDRSACEVVKVVDQKHIYIRRLKAVRTDENGMSDCQTYRYEQDTTKPIEELQLTKYGWKKVIRYNKELYNKIFKERGYVIGWGQEVFEKVLNQNKEVKKTYKVSISFGIADEYYDYSF